MPNISFEEVTIVPHLSEIVKLALYLEQKKVPYELKALWGGLHLMYPNAKKTICSIIEHWGSYGYQDNRLEIMGLLTPEEKKYDVYLGDLTAEEVANRIVWHYRIATKEGEER